jgi:hypothetical protein
MDAATLYMVLTLPNGEQSTSTVEFRSLHACEQKVVWLELMERRHRQPLGAVTSYRCKEHKIRPAFYLFVRGTTAREHVWPFWPLSRQGCTAYKWVLHMGDRGRTARCLEWPRSTDADGTKWEPDGLDMRGQPGQK